MDSEETKNHGTPALKTRLQNLEYESQSLLLHCHLNFKKVGMLWSMGKDSTALLWMARKMFQGQIPFPLFHIDTSFKIPEMIQFREKLRQEWQLPLKVYSPTLALQAGMNSTRGKLNCCRALKTEPLLSLIEENDLDCLIIGIRRDEEGSRSKERFFSLRKPDGSWNYTEQETEIQGLWPEIAPQRQHYRVHPLLSWTEKDIWHYTQQEQIPFSELYLSREGKRYRSLGCAPCTGQIQSSASNLDQILQELHHTQTSERAGRAQDTEVSYGLEKLRAEGYM